MADKVRAANSGSRADASSPQAVSTEGFDPGRKPITALGVKLCLCGSGARLRADDNNRYWFVQCGECGRASIHSRTSEEAVAGWNDPYPRTTEAPNGNEA